jgi:tripartite-type tricarboxylate transporter receptor subunit TctC
MSGKGSQPRRRHRLFVAALFAAMPVAAVAQDRYPDRPITMVVPFAAGGSVDTVTRTLASRLGEILGQQVVVENVGGAGGMTGANRVARAKPDGYQVLLGNVATHAMSQTLYKKPLYNAATDFTPVGMTIQTIWVLVARKDLPATTLPEFIAYAKANEPKMQYGSAGAGSGTHIACVLLNMAMGTQITHVPYRGTAVAMQDLLASRIDFMCDVITGARPYIESGDVKAIATLAPRRGSVLPDLATAMEQGLKEFDVYGWNALFFPKGAPAAIVRRMSDALNETLNTPSVQQRVEALGISIVPPEFRGPAFLAAQIPQEIERWAAPIKASGVTLD